MFGKLPLILSVLVLFYVGALVTYAEPAFSTLQLLTPTIAANNSTLLYLLYRGDTLLMPIIAVGVGLSTFLGVFRIRYQWHFRTLVVAILALQLLILVISLSIWGTARAGPLMGLCFDVGAIITGPVAVPTLLSIGIGVSKSKSKNKIEPENLKLESKKASEQIDVVGEASAVEQYQTQANQIMVGLGIVTICASLPILTTQILSLVLLGMGLVDSSQFEKEGFILTSPDVVTDVIN